MLSIGLDSKFEVKRFEYLPELVGCWWWRVPLNGAGHESGIAHDTTLPLEVTDRNGLGRGP